MQIGMRVLEAEVHRGRGAKAAIQPVLRNQQGCLHVLCGGVTTCAYVTGEGPESQQVVERIPSRQDSDSNLDMPDTSV